jgi:signal transduction histidine kinase
VEDLLDVSRIEQNRLPINCVSLNVETIVLEIVDEMKSLLKPDLILKNSLKDISSVSADSERMKQILVNLISNAIKYTPKGNVEILSKEDDKFVYLTVSDTGIGLSAENMKNLFSKFYRVKNEKTEKISGTGLGLWISREIARKMGGDIEVESIENVGSHFTLKLKKA